MITHETAIRIANAHREIKASKEFLAELEAKYSAGEDYTWSDRQRADRDNGRTVAEISVPLGMQNGSHRLYNIKPKLTMAVIRAHIADQQRELAQANECARIELDTQE